MPRAVIVDCAIDQGGSVEGIHETTHSDPVFERHQVLHYAVGNVPGSFVSAIKQSEGFDPVARWDVKQHTVGYGTRATSPTGICAVRIPPTIS